MPNITVTLTPAGAITNGARWCVEGKTEWKASGTSYSAVAGTYIIQYRYTEGYCTPAEESVVVAGSNVSVTGTYASTAWKSGWQPPISMCIFRGQVFTCGVKHTTPDSGVSDARLVRWSEIGAFRFLNNTANPLRNEAGEYYLGKSDSEMAMRVLPLKDYVVVYGSFSTIALKPVTEPAPTYSPSLVMPTGIKQPLAVGGDTSGHLLIDRSGYLRIVVQEQAGVSSKIIGHQTIFSDMQSDLSMDTGIGLISIVHNPDDDEFYISDGRRSFLYYEGRLTELDKAYTTYIKPGGALLSSHESHIFTDLPMSCVTLLDAYPMLYFSTDPTNFNISGAKLIQSIELIGSFKDAEVSVDWRNNKSEPFQSTPWRRCSPSGVGKPNVAGSDVRINCRMPYQDAHIDSIIVEWQLSDKNAVRGNYVSNASS